MNVLVFMFVFVISNIVLHTFDQFIENQLTSFFFLLLFLLFLIFCHTMCSTSHSICSILIIWSFSILVFSSMQFQPYEVPLGIPNLCINCFVLCDFALWTKSNACVIFFVFVTFGRSFLSKLIALCQLKRSSENVCRGALKALTMRNNACKRVYYDDT